MSASVTVQQLKSLLESDVAYAVIDVRERGEFNKKQIFGTTSLPRRDLEYHMSRLVPVKSTTIVLCDDSDGRAFLAAATLEQLGYTDASVLDGGLTAWAGAGYELAEGTNTPSKDFGEKVLVRKSVPEMTIQEYNERVSKGEQFILIDTRTPEEFQRATLPGSRNIPNGELVLRIKDVIGDSDAPVIVHCGGRTRSIIGTQILREMGIPNPLMGLQNGTMGWLLAGYELEVGRTPEPLQAPSPAGQAAAEEFASMLAKSHQIPHLSVVELQAMIARREYETLYLVDVRTAEEYESGHIPGFTWSPGGQAIQRTDELVAVRTGNVVLACDGHIRATVVARWFKEMGLRNVFVLDGGVVAWEGSGLPTEKGWPKAAPVGLDEARAKTRFLSASKLNKALSSSVAPLIVDLETSRDFTEGHVPGAVWIPRGWLELRIAEHAPNKDAPIVLTCKDGELSTLASAALREMGYTNVSALKGGTSAWVNAGFQLKTSMGTTSVEPDDVVAHPLGDRARMEYYLTWEEALGRKYEG